MNIFVAILCIVAFGAGIWGWWIENGRSDKKQEEDKNVNKDAEE